MKLVRDQGTAAPPPRISVIVPAFRHERFIDDCLASVAACATPEALELIVIDDGSPDRTLTVAAAAPIPATLRYRLYTKPNGGLVESLRAGLALARAPFLCTMASDDRFAPGGLDTALGAVQGADEATALLCDARPMDEEGNVSAHSVYAPATDAMFALGAAERYAALSVRYPAPMLLQSSILPVALLRAERMWDDGLELDDWPTFLKIARAEADGRARLRFRRDLLLAHYCMTAGAVHTDPSRMQRMCLQVALELVEPRFRARAEHFVRTRAAIAYGLCGSSGAVAHALWYAVRARPSPGAVASTVAIAVRLMLEMTARAIVGGQRVNLWKAGLRQRFQ